MHTFPHAAVVFALASAFLFALTNHFQSLGLDGSDARTGSIINIATGAAFYWLLSPFFLEGWYWFSWGAVLFAMVGIIRPSISSFLAILSIQVMGPTLTSALTATAPIFSAFFAVFLLGEHLDLQTAIGILAVMTGAVVATYRRQGIVRDWALWALALPLGAALVRAAGHAVTKMGLADVPSPSFAVMLSNTVSLVIALTAFRIEGRRYSGT
ncbi:MAG: EamA family transporter [Hyphomicrobiaceae bacterium]